MKSIYLSPSTQENNVGAGNYGTEEQRMNEIMDLIENQLRGHYILYRNRPNMTLQQVVADSNAKNPDLHFALHSNAGGGSGAECWICAKGGQAEKFANRLYEELSALTPGKDRGVKVSASLYEVNRTESSGGDLGSGVPRHPRGRGLDRGQQRGHRPGLRPGHHGPFRRQGTACHCGNPRHGSSGTLV